MHISGIKRYAALAAALAVLLASFSACSVNTNESGAENTAAKSSSAAETSSSEGDTSDKSSEQAADSSAAETSSASDYADKLFDTSYVHKIDITLSEDDWSDLKTNPLAKTKYKASVTVDGETVENVSFATKGNTSLSSVAEDKDSDRYSFKVNFGKYVKGQTYRGLNKLNLNNIYADATYMKDYLSYEIFRQAGVDSPLVSYVWVTVNGKDQGLYIAVEDISESYLDRTNEGEGELYKPETDRLDNVNMKQGGGNMQEGNDRPDRRSEGDGNSDGEGKGGFRPDMQEGGRMQPPEGFENMTPPEDLGSMTLPEGFENINPEDFKNMTPPDMTESGGMPDPDMKQGGPGGFGESSAGASLAYTDDKIESYSDIFDNDETDADDEAKQRVIAALKGLSEGKELDKYIDTDEVIRYFAAHNFVLNYDSYTGNMLHNYYLYEKDGRLSMLPWDYNLAFGGFGGGMGGKDGEGSDAAKLINTGIDTPLSGTEESSRPMWSWITSNSEYLEKYHQVYDELLKSYFESGEYEKQMDSIYEMILPYIEKDTGAFYNAEQFKTAFAQLKQFCKLRAESIRAQLDGTLSAETDKQDADKRISASDINLEAMGSHGGGKGGKDRPTDK
ncbi:CotH protein [Ruminococcaceae bacterium FB2012]|nr:CotH protein [Ruminococcaceae bacterium FB2012]